MVRGLLRSCDTSVIHTYIVLWTFPRLYQRWALPTEFRYSDRYWTKLELLEYRTNISIGLQLSDYQHWTSIVRQLSDLQNFISLMKEPLTLLMLLRRVQGLVAGLVETVSRSRNHTVFSQPAVSGGSCRRMRKNCRVDFLRLFVICQDLENLKI